MSFFNVKLHLLALFLYTSLFMQSIAAVPPQEMYGEPCQPYSILCIISFFMGILLYIFIHQCCIYQPTPSSIPPTINKENSDKKH